MKNAILGIPCQLRTTAARKAVRQVLTQIKQRYPRDFERIKTKVIEFVPLNENEHKDGTLGMWKEEHGEKGPLNPETWSLKTWSLQGDEPGRVLLLESNPEHLLATVAHELGHACSTEDDKDRGADCDEWNWELAADWYAYKWGFGRHIAKMHRNWLHHCVGPGHWFEIDGTRFQVTRNFRVREA